MKILRLLTILFIVGVLVYGQTVVVRKGLFRKFKCAPRAVGEGPPPPPPTDSIGAEWYRTFNPTGGPIGGIGGYPDTIRHQGADEVVHNLADLINYVTNASKGDIIYIYDTCNIDFSGQTALIVPDGVTIASGRGRTLSDTLSWGALIYIQNLTASPSHIFNLQDTTRVTGLRLRGSYDYPNLSPSDSFTQNAAAEQALLIYSSGGRDSVEVDNCEIWGWGYSPFLARGPATNIVFHHNHFHTQGHVLLGYGTVYYRDIDVKFEANYFDYTAPQHGGGDSCYNSAAEYSYCIFGEHSKRAVIYAHKDVDYAVATANIHNCTFQRRGYAGLQQNITCYKQDYNLFKDTIKINYTWFWDTDSAKAISIPNMDSFSIHHNHFTTTPPDGVLGLLPTAAIVVDSDSGSPPFAVKFKMTGSSDPDGNLTAFFWRFGDSCATNKTRLTDSDDSVSHTYGEIGNYLAELRVFDDDGCQDVAYQTIKVTPTNDDSHFVSCWTKDLHYSNSTGYFKKQILLDDWVIYDEDIAGSGSWEHIIVDVTDTLDTKDSVTITFQLVCIKDTAYFRKPVFIVDDVVIYGANVVNGDFESGTWTGTSKRTDGSWIGDEVRPYGGDPYYQWEWYNSTKGGVRSYAIGRMSAGTQAVHNGDTSKVYQRLNVD